MKTEELTFFRDNFFAQKLKRNKAFFTMKTEELTFFRHNFFAQKLKRND